MWKSLGTTLLGLAGGLGAALLNAFQTPIVYLQAGMEWVVAHLLKGLLKIPGMSELLGLDGNALETNFGKILKDRKESGAELFGMNFKEMAEEAQGVLGRGAPELGERVAAAAKKAGETTGSDLIDTSGLRDSFGKVAQSIRDTMPKPEEVKQAAATAAKVTNETAPAAAKPAQSRLDPIVTSLGKVGGGGYSTGTLDAQRENNRLTNETNRLLREIGDRIGTQSVQTASVFG